MAVNSNLLSTWSYFTYRHAWLCLLFFLVLGISGFYVAKTLHMDADLAALLPDSFDSVQDLELAKKRFGGIGYIVITGRSSDASALRQFADDVAERTHKLPGVSFVDYRRPVEFFQDRALYFLDTEDLSVIYSRLKDRYKWESQKRNPMYIDLENTPAPPMDFSDLEEKYSGTGKSHWIASQKSAEAYYFNTEKTLIAIFIKPERPASDLKFSSDLLQRISTAIDGIELNTGQDKIQIGFTGRYQKQLDMQQQMQSDLSRASSVALLLVIGYLLLHFRRLSALVLILVPLISGLILTFAFAALTFGQLNILTAFIGVILLGLGIDHGIHLLSRYQDERRRTDDDYQIIHHTFASTGRAVFMASLTTLIIFIGLALSDFRAFYEFGIIASAGMIFIIAAYLLILPSLLNVFKRHIHLANLDAPTSYRVLNSFNFLLKRSSLPTLVVIFLIGLFSLNIINLKFNYDFESLGNADLASFKLDKEVNQLLGYSQTPMVALTNTINEERFVATQFHDRHEQLQSQSGLDFILATTDLIPVAQEDKQKIILKIKKIVDKVKESWLDSEDLARLQDFKRMVATFPFSYDDLPLEIRQLFGANSVSHPTGRGTVMLFPSISLSDGERVIKLAEEIRQTRLTDGGRVPVAGESMLLADILNLVFAEAPKIMLLCLSLIFLSMWFYMKKLHYALLCLTPAVLTLLLCLSLMALLDIELNYINLLMIPVLLGIGVDSGIHMVSRAIEGEPINDVVAETGLAIFGSIVTSGLGIGALLLTNHAGLNSLALVGVCGLVINLVISLILLPKLIQISTINKPLVSASK